VHHSWREHCFVVVAVFVFFSSESIVSLLNLYEQSSYTSFKEYNEVTFSVSYVFKTAQRLVA
jgi:hypothetical protein